MSNESGPHWVPAATKDLIADAMEFQGIKVSRRMIIDWTEKGLLDRPSFQKSTQYGSDSRLYSPQQRLLFQKLLKARKWGIGNHFGLARLLLRSWLEGFPDVADSQARRLWRTWAEGIGKTTAVEDLRIAREEVNRLAHPSADRKHRAAAHELLLRLKGEMNRMGDTTYWDMLRSALVEICSPWPAAPGKRIERAIGPVISPYGVREYIAVFMIWQQVVHRLRHEQIPEAVLLKAREKYRVAMVDYAEHWPAFQEISRERLIPVPKDMAVNPAVHFMLILGVSPSLNLPDAETLLSFSASSR